MAVRAVGGEFPVVPAEQSADPVARFVTGFVRRVGGEEPLRGPEGSGLTLQCCQKCHRICTGALS
jgi:hypothetical protein